MNRQLRQTDRTPEPRPSESRIQFVQWGMGRLFPELGRFRDFKHRRQAWETALYEASRPWQWSGLGLSFVVAGGVVVFIVGPFLIKAMLKQPGAAGTPWQWIALATLAGVMLGTALFMTIMVFRRSIQSSLRRQLVREGSPTCLDCGYDLTANVSGKCPECGIPIDSVAACDAGHEDPPE